MPLNGILCLFLIGDLNEKSRAQLSEGSVTLEAEELQRTSQVDEDDRTLTASRNQTEVAQALPKGHLRLPCCGFQIRWPKVICGKCVPLFFWLQFYYSVL